MSDERDDRETVAAAELKGHMYLYEQPELLAKEEHGDLGLSPMENPFGFTRNIRMVPVVFSEIASVQKHYPVVFTDLENPIPVAVLGVLEDVNLFVDAEGRWDSSSYVPSYLRRYPFAFARHSEERFSIVIDRVAAVISENPQFPFFDGDEVTENTQSMINFCTQYEAERVRTSEFCTRLKELNLLAAQQVGHRSNGGEEAPMATYVAVDVERLNDLDKDVLQQLHQSGYLAAMFAQVFSQENWNLLLERRARLQRDADPG